MCRLRCGAGLLFGFIVLWVKSAGLYCPRVFHSQHKSMILGFKSNMQTSLRQNIHQKATETPHFLRFWSCCWYKLQHAPTRTLSDYHAALSSAADIVLCSLCPADGAPLSELSWSSSLAVVAISFSGLFTFVFLMLACLCCKKGKMGFKVGWMMSFEWKLTRKDRGKKTSKSTFRHV